MIPYIVGGAIFAAALLIFTATSNRLKCRNYLIKSHKLSEEITIAHISDLHECSFGRGQIKLLNMVREASPDIIVVTGDTFEDDEKTVGLENEENPALVFLEKVTEIAPCYMVFGNHERFVTDMDTLCGKIESLGVRLLHPLGGEGVCCEKIKLGDCEIFICGAADPYFSYAAKNRAHKKLRQILFEDKNINNPQKENWRRKITDTLPDVSKKDEFSILLSHRPEEYEFYEKLGFDAVFSGHAHGGQWRFPPFINGLYAPHQGIFPPHAGGGYALGKGFHIVSRGLSKKRMFRLFNRPEVCILKISKDFHHSPQK